MESGEWDEWYQQQAANTPLPPQIRGINKFGLQAPTLFSVRLT